MKLIALADLPNGVKSGEPFEVNDYQANLLKTIGVAKDDEAPVRRLPTRRAVPYSGGQD